MQKGNSGVGMAIRLLLLRDYLLANATKEHPLSCQQIIDYLEKEGYPVEKKTVYRDLAVLQDYFSIVVIYDIHRKKYYIENPPFKSHELRYMIDSVQASKFITETIANRITKKIRNMAGEQLRKELNRPSYVADRVRSMNDSVVEEADKLHKAISTDRKTAFQYFHYSPSRSNPKSYSKSGQKVIVSPFALYWNNGNYYLYAYDGKKFRFYRVDRMECISEPLFEKREGHELFEKQDLTNKKVKVFDMYSTGKIYEIKFRCHNRIAHAVIDQFGKDIMMMSDDDKHFTFTQFVEISPPFFAWVATFGRSIQIVNPAPVVEEMRLFLKKSLDMYNNDGNT